MNFLVVIVLTFLGVCSYDLKASDLDKYSLDRLLRLEKELQRTLSDKAKQVTELKLDVERLTAAKSSREQGIELVRSMVEEYEVHKHTLQDLNSKIEETSASCDASSETLRVLEGDVMMARPADCSA
ncbi:hypothetical protein NDN08_003216 [Rhodosorus marinus]|uniref:Uncharacterized protein n=1 Tax=Rhodosorus marinus TaxID=101924 RepID=A0AAV8V059_9RHOD|nr:hypothetical protein NDN08_003216 [Rhodosorus marinus]